MSSPSPPVEPLAERKRRFVELVEDATARRLSEMQRRHSSCVALGLGPVALARTFRPERLPSGDDLATLALELVDWALGLSPPEPRPYVAEDVEGAPRGA